MADLPSHPAELEEAAHRARLSWWRCLFWMALSTAHLERRAFAVPLVRMGLTDRMDLQDRQEQPALAQPERLARKAPSVLQAIQARVETKAGKVRLGLPVLPGRQAARGRQVPGGP